MTGSEPGMPSQTTQLNLSNAIKSNPTRMLHFYVSLIIISYIFYQEPVGQLQQRLYDVPHHPFDDHGVFDILYIYILFCPFSVHHVVVEVHHHRRRDDVHRMCFRNF
jgi:hypothetical protein